MKTLLHAPLLLGLYLIVMFIMYGMTSSISDTAKHHTKAWEKAFFSLAIWLGVVIPFAILGFEASEGSPWQFLWLFACGGIGFVGAAQAFWNGDLEYRVHMAGAIGGIMAGMLAIVLTLTSWFTIGLVVAFAAFALIQWLPKKWVVNNPLEAVRVNTPTYWVEVVAILVVVLAFLLSPFPLEN